MNELFVKCPLCGATVKQGEIKEHGYCQVCRLLVEELTSQTRAEGGQ